MVAWFLALVVTVSSTESSSVRRFLQEARRRRFVMVVAVAELTNGIVEPVTRSKTALARGLLSC